MAQADFRALRRLWIHAAVARQDKLQFFKSFVVSKLGNGLQTACLSKAARRRLDGSRARCLRRVAGIAPAHVSRVSNETVRQGLGVATLSTTLLAPQLSLFGRLARSPDGSALRDAVFMPF